MTTRATGEANAAARAAAALDLALLPPGPAPLGIAVSGGGDSLALLMLLHDRATALGLRLHAVTVDHRLRPEAAQEARAVARACAGLGLGHDTLVWDHGGALPPGNLMQAAREARYGLIAGWAMRRGIAHVALAHTAEDQAETLLLALSRASGIDGLSGMRPRWRVGEVSFLRPLLTARRDDLRAILAARGVPWAEDPTNEDATFARIRARRALAVLAPLGIGVEALARSAAHLAQARAALDATLAAFLRDHAALAAGALTLPRAAFAALPEELRRRLLVTALRWIAGTPHPPRAADLARLEAAALAGREATLGGCRLRAPAADLRLQREERAVATLRALPGQPWDGRWRLSAPNAPRGAEVRALGAAGLASCPVWRATGLPRDVLVTTPALWLGERLLAAPLAGLDGGAQIACTAPTTDFLLSD